MTTTNIKTLTLRGISLFVAIAFAMTTLVGSPSQAFAVSEIFNLLGGSKSQSALRSDLYAMPAELGSLVSLWEPPVGTSPHGFVVQIQDAHANPEGQQNVAGMLRYLETKFPGLVVGLEGTTEELHPEYLKFFKEFPAANRAVIEDLHQKGELNGAELFLLEQSKKSEGRSVESAASDFGAVRANVRGVETLKLYRDNLMTYLDLLQKCDQIQMLLAPIRARLEKESSKVLNGELRAFLKERSRRKEGRYNLTGSTSDSDLQAYVRYLQKQSLKVLEVDLKDPIARLAAAQAVVRERVGKKK